MKTKAHTTLTGDENYDAILKTVDEIREGYRRDNPPLPALPSSFSIDLPDNIRMKIGFERVETKAR